MLVEHHCIEAHLLGIDRFVEILLVKPRALLGIEEFVWQPKEGAILDHLVLGYVAVRPFGEIHQLH